MKRVTGIGGVFFKCKDREAQKNWYTNHLGFDIQSWGGTSFWWRDVENAEKKCATVWSMFGDDSKYYEPSKKDFMFNYRVENLEELLKLLKEEGVEQVGEVETLEYGKFAWIMDPEGNKIELWEAVDEKL